MSITKQMLLDAYDRALHYCNWEEPDLYRVIAFLPDDKKQENEKDDKETYEAKKKLIRELNKIKKDPNRDIEKTHMDADEALLRYIDDDKLTELFHSIDKWYA